MPDPWYPPPTEYYVPDREAQEYPLRQGDLVGPVRIDGTDTAIVQVVHPTCELGKSGVDRLQICEVKRLSNLADDFQRACVVAGMREKDGRFCILLSVDQVRDLEAERIRADPAFGGPLPAWAI